MYRELLSQDSARSKSLFLVCLLTLALLFGTQAGVERRTGMARVCQATPRGRGMLRRRRHGAAWILTSAFSVSVWSVQLIQLARSYGTLPYPQAPACCLTFLEDLPGESVSWGFGSCSLWREPYRCAFGAVSSLGQRKNWENGGKTMELNIESLTKHYGDLCALGDFTVCLRPGVDGLLGPNGAGKSTLMNLLTDTVKREAGSIRYNGKEILELGRGYRALVGYMPQQQGYYEEFTVGRFLYYMAALKGLPRSKARGKSQNFWRSLACQTVSTKKWAASPAACVNGFCWCRPSWARPRCFFWMNPPPGWTQRNGIRIRNYISAIATERIAPPGHTRGV